MRSGSENVGGRMVSPSEAGTQAAKEADRIQQSRGQYGGGGGGYNSGCFPAGTMIATPQGQTNIEQIAANDQDLSVHPLTGEQSTRRVLRVNTHRSRQLWRIRFADETLVRTTATHSFRIGTAWRSAAQIRPGDKACHIDTSGDFKTHVVGESAPTTEVADVFNLIVEGENNFIADGTLAHSFTHFRTLRGMLWNMAAKMRRVSKHRPGARVATT